MLSTTPVFDRNLLRLKRQRASKTISDYNFLLEWAGKNMAMRLQDIKRSFPIAINIGARTPREIYNGWKNIANIQNLYHIDLHTSADPANHMLIADEELFPFKQDALDLVLTNLSLHSVNDLPGALIQIQRSLKPDGLFIASMFGGETLWQLRQSLSHAETCLKNGLSPRIFPFADKQQMGGLLQRAEFALPVIDSEILTVTYPDSYKLMRDLRGMGEGNIISARNKSNPGKEFFACANDFYLEHFSDGNGKIEATFEIIFLIGWSPHNSQQKPLRPGSAQKRLADALGTTEISTGDKTGH